MSTIAEAKVAHNYNWNNGYLFGCLQFNIRHKYNLGIKNI